jgi:hypothetical protein
MVNPMRQNWDEMVEFVKWTHDNRVKLWYNTIRYPENCAIWNLPSEKLKTIYETLKNKMDSDIDKNYYNYEKIDHLVNNQIRTWLLDSYI